MAPGQKGPGCVWLTRMADAALATAAAALGCTKERALVLMQEACGDMRQLHFEADFWPGLHERVQHAAAAGAPLPAAFYERLAEALATLSAHDIRMMRVDFVRFPAEPGEVETRSVALGDGGAGDGGAPRALFRFAGARRDAPMRPIAGADIRVLRVEWPTPAAEAGPL